MLRHCPAVVIPLVLVATLTISPLAAEPDHATQPPAEIGFPEAVGLAATAPEVVGAQHGIDLTRAAIEAANHGWSPLAIRVMPQLAVGTPEGFGARIAVEQAIPLTDRRGATRASAAALTAQRIAEARARSFELRLAIGEAWIQSWIANAERARARDALQIALSIVELTTRGRAAGAFTQLELAEVKTLAAEASATALDAEGRGTDAAFELGAALGRGVPRSAGATLPEVVIPERVIPDVVARLPEVRARRLAAISARTRGAEARTARAYELIVGGELLADPGGDRRGAVTLGITLPHDRGRRELLEARAEAARQDGEAEAIAARSSIAIGRAIHDIEHGRELLALIDQELLPALDDAARQRKRAFELGEATVLEVLAGERAALAGRRAAIEARAQHAWARIQLALWLEDGGSL